MPIVLIKKKTMVHDLGSSHNSGTNKSDLTSLDRIKNGCTDDAWWKLKVYCHCNDISNYADGCIICLKLISTVHVHQWRSAMVAWCVQYVIIFFLLTTFRSFLTPWPVLAFVLNFLFLSKQMIQAHTSCKWTVLLNNKQLSWWHFVQVILPIYHDKDHW